MKKPRKAPTASKKVPNPFEVHINKQKMTVLGQKNKNDRGLPGVSRAKALKKRKQTILQEYKLQHKSNKFLDRRIGEKGTEMTTEDKVMARFTAIRRRGHKKSIYNLAEDEVLTHKGQSLSEIEKFDDPRSDEEEDEEILTGNLDSNFVKDAHFGGGILTRTGKEGAKTHRELIDELIAESKKRKAEKQKTKEATLELTEKLDTEWKDLLPIVSKNRKDQELEKVAPIEDYDKIMRELRFEARGTVSDRLKTQEEIAKEENEKLEELEKDRQDRMKGFQEKKFKHRSADDLDDDLVYESDPEYMLSYNKEGESNLGILKNLSDDHIETNESDDHIETNDSDDHIETNETEEEAETEEEEAETDDDLSDLKAETSDSEIEEPEVAKVSEIEEPEVAKVSEIESTKNDNFKEIEDTENKESIEIEKAREELPYTFQLPASYDDLRKLLEDRSPDHLSVILERMIKCNHPSLSEKNKENLKLLFAYLLQYLNDCVCEENPFRIFSALAPSIFDLTQLDKVNSYLSIKEVIKEKYQDFKKHKKTYPGLEVLFFFKLVSLLFPTSDFRHGVITPCLVFMEQILNNCKVKSRRDIAFGLFLVTLVLEFTTLSQRYMPAAINYLGGLLHMAIPKVGVKLIKVNPPFQATASSLVLVTDNKDDFGLKMEFSDLLDVKIDDFFKIRVLYVTLRLIEDFESNLSKLSSNVEIFKDVVAYLELLPTRNYPRIVSEQFEKVSRQLKDRKNDRKLDFIVMEALRPKALRLYEPKIEEVFEGRKRKVQSRDKAERDKLLHKLKKETKGALREIRRDKAFLGRVKIQQRIRSDNERRDRVKRIYSEAAVQQSELNSLERTKKRK